ncbi:MAG: hypothetical protein AAF990_27080, partial [Bacteroidota bacterium]
LSFLPSPLSTKSHSHPHSTTASPSPSRTTRRLRSEGETVESIVLLDPPRWLTEPVDPSEIKRDYTREEIAKFVVSDIGWSAPMDFDQLLADLKPQPMDAAWRIGIEHLEKYEVLSKKVMPEDLKRSFVNKFFNDKVLAIFFAEQQYKLPPVEEDSLVIMFTQKSDIDLSSPEVHQYVRKNFATQFQLHHFGGTHATLFLPENIHSWIDVLSEYFSDF